LTVYTEHERREYTRYAILFGLPEERKKITRENLEWALKRINPMEPESPFPLNIWVGYSEHFRNIVMLLLYNLEN